MIFAPLLAICCVLYIFYALHAITDGFFVPACTICCDWLHLPDDVAGATLLGAGLNAPELFGHVVGLASGNAVGLGAITGSFNFNVLVISGFTALLTPPKVRLQLEWRFVTRDVLAYVVSLALLQWTALDGLVLPFELAMLLCAYALYIVTCLMTGTIMRRCCRPKSSAQKARRRIRPTLAPAPDLLPLPPVANQSWIEGGERPVVYKPSLVAPLIGARRLNPSERSADYPGHVQATHVPSPQGQFASGAGTFGLEGGPLEREGGAGADYAPLGARKLTDTSIGSEPDESEQEQTPSWRLQRGASRGVGTLGQSVRGSFATLSHALAQSSPAPLRGLARGLSMASVSIASALHSLDDDSDSAALHGGGGGGGGSVGGGLGYEDSLLAGGSAAGGEFPTEHSRLTGPRRSVGGPRMAYAGGAGGGSSSLNLAILEGRLDEGAGRSIANLLRSNTRYGSELNLQQKGAAPGSAVSAAAAAAAVAFVQPDSPLVTALPSELEARLAYAAHVRAARRAGYNLRSAAPPPAGGAAEIVRAALQAAGTRPSLTAFAERFGSSRGSSLGSGSVGAFGMGAARGSASEAGPVGAGGYSCPPSMPSSCACLQGLGSSEYAPPPSYGAGLQPESDGLDAEVPEAVIEAVGAHSPLSETILDWPGPAAPWSAWAFAVLNRPLALCLYLSFPSSAAMERGWFVVAMLVSVCYLALVTYAMSLLCDSIAVAWGIPTELLGSTVVAMGTSLPNVFAAIAVGRQGKADMAVCQAFGSNAFDVLVAFALPLAVKSAYLRGEPLVVEAPGLSRDVTVDLVFVALFIALMFAYRGRMRPSFGLCSLVLYLCWFTANLVSVYAVELDRILGRLERPRH